MADRSTSHRPGDATGKAAAEARAANEAELRTKQQGMSMLTVPTYDEPDDTVVGLDGRPTGDIATVEELLGTDLRSGPSATLEELATQQRGDSVDPALARAGAKARAPREVAVAGPALQPPALTEPAPSSTPPAGAPATVAPVDVDMLLSMQVITEEQATALRALQAVGGPGPTPGLSEADIERRITAAVSRAMHNVEGLAVDDQGQIVHAKVSEQRTVKARMLEDLLQFTWGNQVDPVDLKRGQVVEFPVEVYEHLKERDYV